MQHIRYITVPKDKNASIALDFDTAKADELIEWQLTETEFMELWNLKLFDQINSSCQTMIDDYESERITETMLLKQCFTLTTQAQKQANGSVKRFSEMIKYAIDFETGLYFYF